MQQRHMLIYCTVEIGTAFFVSLLVGVEFIHVHNALQILSLFETMRVVLAVSQMTDIPIQPITVDFDQVSSYK